MKVTIICLTYKCPELLQECIYSILKQSYTNWELLIINDYKDQKLILEFPNIKIFNLPEKFKTLGDKRNFGLENATGDLILYLEDKDLLFPDYIRNIIKLIDRNDWLSIQRSILYYSDNIKNTCLSDIPTPNTFVYKRNSIGNKFRYESKDTDILIEFYKNVIKFGNGNGLFKQLNPKDYGYICRQNIFEPEITSEKTGDILLNPYWKQDYVNIIKSNINYNIKKIINDIPPSSGNSVLSKWNKVKSTWEKADSFLSSINSRGLLSTALNITNITNKLGEKVSEETYNKRKESCFGNKEKNIPQCIHLKTVPNKGSFCGSCGCGSYKLARLDGDGYTKLHYPHLECPLERNGFSNYDGELLSIIITALNEDPKMINNTIKSIKETTSSNVEIILIDDYSDNIVTIDDPSVKLIRNPSRIGVGPSRHLGATIAKNKYILLTDSHMLFDPGWYEQFVFRAKTEKENVAFCGVCLGLDSEHGTLKENAGRYNGARLALYEEKENQVLEGKWIDEKPGDSYEISCMMGAIYFINREYFLKLRGLSDLKMWGSDEPCLSIKIYLSGGKILLDKKIKVGHFFRKSAPYTTGCSHLIYNKIRMAKTLLPDELGEYLISKIKKDNNFNAAMKMIEDEKDLINEYKQYYKSIFTVDIKDICTKFDIKMY